jgi:hypothetical protein
MKVGQNSIIRWVGKLIGKEPQRLASAPSSKMQTLDEAQLRQVGGGTGQNTGTPTKGW